MSDATHVGVGEWADDPASLLALALVLEQLIGPEPAGEVLDDPDVCGAWHARHDRAAEIVAELANRDSELLRLVIGPPAEASSPGRGLLTLAALKTEQPR